MVSGASSTPRSQPHIRVTWADGSGSDDAILALSLVARWSRQGTPRMRRDPGSPAPALSGSPGSRCRRTAPAWSPMTNRRLSRSQAPVNGWPVRSSRSTRRPVANSRTALVGSLGGSRQEHLSIGRYRRHTHRLHVTGKLAEFLTRLDVE